MEQSNEAQLHFLDYWRVIRSRKEVILAVTLLVVLTGTGVTFMLPKKYAATVRILVRQDATDIDVFERQFSAAYNPFFLRTQYEIIKSKPILYEVIRNLNLQEIWGQRFLDGERSLTREEAYEMLFGSISVAVARDTSLIEITVYSGEPQESARLANEVANVYRDHRLQAKRREIKSAIDSLQNEMKKQQDKVDAVENRVESIREELGVSMLDRGVSVDKIRLSQLEADRLAANVDRVVRKARYEQLVNLEGEDLLNASAYIVNDPALARIRSDLVNTEVSLKLALETYGSNHPEVKRLVAGRDELKQQLENAKALHCPRFFAAA